MHRSARRLSILSLLLVGTWLSAACGDDDVAPAPGRDAGTTPTDAAPDTSSTADASADSPSASDAAPDAPPAGAIPDGKYVLDSWTCTQGDGGVIDVKAFALTLQIQAVAQTISGTTGSVEVTYPAGCLRTVPVKSITYPSAGMVSSTAGGNRTCTASCPANQCTPGIEPDVSATNAFTYAAPTLTFTRTFVTEPSLQALAGCVTNDMEKAVYIKQ
jgi:hypothetical protein